MRQPRIYHPETIHLDDEMELATEAANHVGRVLRMQAGQPLELFNGDGHNYAAVITQVDKRAVQVKVTEKQVNASESPLRIHLGQGISRGERMDFVLQKSVELGVASITPLFTERCGVKLSGDRLLKKQQQWQKIVLSACEQSGRSVVPEVHTPVPLTNWFSQPATGMRLTLDPRAPKALRELPLQDVTQVQLLIGPEGGLSESEIASAAEHEFLPVRLGPRVLRTETAALTALSVLQYQFGDLA